VRDVLSNTIQRGTPIYGLELRRRWRSYSRIFRRLPVDTLKKYLYDLYRCGDS